MIVGETVVSNSWTKTIQVLPVQMVESFVLVQPAWMIFLINLPRTASNSVLETHLCTVVEHVDTSLLVVDPFGQVYEGHTSRILFVVVGYDLNLLYSESALAQVHPIHLYLNVRSYLCEKNKLAKSRFVEKNMWCLMTSL